MSKLIIDGEKPYTYTPETAKEHGLSQDEIDRIFGTSVIVADPSVETRTREGDETL